MIYIWRTQIISISAKAIVKGHYDEYTFLVIDTQWLTQHCLLVAQSEREQNKKKTQRKQKTQWSKGCRKVNWYPLTNSYYIGIYILVHVHYPKMLRISILICFRSLLRFGIIIALCKHTHRLYSHTFVLRFRSVHFGSAYFHHFFF